MTWFNHDMYKSFWLAFREKNEKRNKGTCGKTFLKSGPNESKLTVNFGKKQIGEPLMCSVQLRFTNQMWLQARTLLYFLIVNSADTLGLILRVNCRLKTTLFCDVQMMCSLFTAEDKDIVISDFWKCCLQVHLLDGH